MNRNNVLKKVLPALTMAIIAATAITTANTTTPVRRYLLSAGVNDGGKERVMLRYAVSDATAFASVLTDMGGVEPGNAIILSNPNSRQLLDGINNLGKLLTKDKAAEPNSRGEVFVYYSGHADESGLKLGTETLGWSEFRNAVSGLDAELRVAVLDACGSGAITRTKGGVVRPAFLSDASSNMKGYAFITSSNENEASQESDRIKGSYFTHALLSGMRGAADMTGDGKVTINEAYQYAFNETLQNTQNTRSGTQHPSRDMNLAGTGDVVMTDLRETSAALSLDTNLEGRFFIRDESGNLFAELRKFRGRAIELGMPPGKYSIEMEAPSRMWMAGGVEIVAGSRTALSMNDMKVMERKVNTARGSDDGVNDVNDSNGINGIDNIDDIVIDENGDSVTVRELMLQRERQRKLLSGDQADGSTKVVVSTVSIPADSSNKNQSTKVLTNPLLDSACRAPYRMNFGVAASVSSKPESGTQLALFSNMASAEFCGTQVSGIINVAAKDMNGLQISSTLNVAGGRFNGTQISTLNMMKDGGDAIQCGALNATGNGLGILQAGSVNISGGDIGILQAGAVNISNGNVGYFQAGPVNIAKGKVGYIQAGSVNLAGDVGYLQAGPVNVVSGKADYAQAGAVNIARNVGIIQAGAVNVAVDAKYQAGSVNLAKKTTRQFGVINISGYSEKTPIGLINIVGNGIFELSYNMETDGYMYFSAHTGTPWLYTLFEYGQQTGSFAEWPKAHGWGLGTRFGMTTPFYVNLDALQMRVYDKDFFNDDGLFNITYWEDIDRIEENARLHSNNLYKVRLGVNYAPIRYVTLSGGAYMNWLVAGRGGEFKINAPESLRSDWKLGDHGAKVRMWPGLYAGVTAGVVRR